MTTTTATPSSAVVVPASLPSPVTEPSTERQPTTPRDEWIIQPGEHLWFVAHETLLEAWGREPTETEVAPYWRTLIEHNRSRLIDPSNPDYVVPNQSFGLPPVPPAPAR
jgi:hypothetical protein